MHKRRSNRTSFCIGSVDLLQYHQYQTPLEVYTERTYIISFQKFNNVVKQGNLRSSGTAGRSESKLIKLNQGELTL